jgi:hypothetical protein
MLSIEYTSFKACHKGGTEGDEVARLEAVYTE